MDRQTYMPKARTVSAAKLRVCVESSKQASGICANSTWVLYVHVLYCIITAQAFSATLPSERGGEHRSHVRTIIFNFYVYLRCILQLNRPAN